jgi:hypothetical protein
MRLLSHDLPTSAGSEGILMHRLAQMVTALDERPGLDQTDAILNELQQMPRDHFVTEVIDALLDYRMLLVASDKLNQPGGPLTQDSFDG